MSFATDLLEGNFGNLGTDIVDAPSSLINHPDQLAETLGGVALIGGGLAFAPEIAGAIGGGAAADLGAGAVGAADLGAADATFGAFDEGLFAANAADAGLGLGGVDALSTSALSVLPEVGSDLGGGSLAFGSDTGGLVGDFAGGGVDTGAGFSVGDTAPELGTGPTDSAGLAAPPAPATPSYVMPGVANAPASADVGLANANASFGAFDPGSVSGGGGLTSQVGSVLNSPWTRIGLAATPLALALGRGEPSLPSSAQQAQANAGALSVFGNQQLAMGTSGTLDAGHMAVLANMRNDLTNTARQQMYNMGVQNPEADSRWVQMKAYVDTQVTAATATMIQQEITNGLQALGASSGTLNQIAQMQMQADQNFTNTLVNATKALGLAAGSGAIKTTTTTTQAAA